MKANCIACRYRDLHGGTVRRVASGIHWMLSGVRSVIAAESPYRRFDGDSHDVVVVRCLHTFSPRNFSKNSLHTRVDWPVDNENL